MKKKIWFWISILEFALIFFLIFGIYAIGEGMTKDYNTLAAEYNALQSSIKDNSKVNNGNVTTKDSTSEKEQRIYNINEEAVIEDANNQPMYSLKIVEVNKGTDKTSEEYTDGKPDNTIEVVYEYKNYNMDTPIKISSQFLSAYSKDGKTGKTMSMMDGQTEVAKDRSSQSRIWIVMPDPVDTLSEIGIDYNNDFSLGFKDTISFDIKL